jgi:hypothetical protein
VRDVVEGSTIVDLAVALIEPSATGDYPARDVECFACPDCQPRPAAWVMTAPAARPAGEMAWRCDRCGAYGTRWELARRVLENPHALARFLALRLVA